MRYLNWRWVERIVVWWRSSLQFRMVTIAVALSAAAVFIIGVSVSFSIGANLFEARRIELEATSANAALIGQRYFDQAAEQPGADDLDVIVTEAASAIVNAAATSAGTEFAILRSPDQDGPRTPADIRSRDLEANNVISPELRTTLQNSDELRNYSQSVALTVDGATHPALVVGSLLDIRGSAYELYLIYDIGDAAETLGFVHRTLLFGGLVLILLIGAVTFAVVRLVVGPVQLAAETSEKLSAGDLEVRIPEKGEDVIATLARSFNGMAESLQSQITRLATLSQVQQRFVADVSHELRTPLTTIRLASEMLYGEREAFQPPTARTAELLFTQVERFELLLADLLEMSRYDAGVVEMETEPSNLVRLAEEAVEAVSALAASKGSQLRLVAPGGYCEAEVDARRIRRILGNLLANAIDHGEGKPIVVWIDSNADAVAIAVRDYGIGMSAAAVARVFDRFWRADPSRQRTTGGTGLGLAISLEDATLHGGRFDVWSVPEQGTCFRLVLPRYRGAQIKTIPLGLPPSDRYEQGVSDA